jgi:hypothetical protein
MHTCHGLSGSDKVYSSSHQQMRQGFCETLVVLHMSFYMWCQDEYPPPGFEKHDFGCLIDNPQRHTNRKPAYALHFKCKNLIHSNDSRINVAGLGDVPHPAMKARTKVESVTTARLYCMRDSERRNGKLFLGTAEKFWKEYSGNRGLIIVSSSRRDILMPKAI